MPGTVSDGTLFNRTAIRLIKGDITDLEVDAFVYYAQHDLALGSGYGTAITIRGGPTVQKELDEMGPLETGQAVISAAGKLKANHIIHAVGPRFSEADMEAKLRTTMCNCLKLAEENGIKRIAFPAMGAGYYMVPRDLSAKVMLDEIKTHLQGESCIEELIIDVLDTPQYETFEPRLAELGEREKSTT